MERNDRADARKSIDEKWTATSRPIFQRSVLVTAAFCFTSRYVYVRRGSTWPWIYMRRYRLSVTLPFWLQRTQSWSRNLLDVSSEYGISSLLIFPYLSVSLCVLFCFCFFSSVGTGRGSEKARRCRIEGQERSTNGRRRSRVWVGVCWGEGQTNYPRINTTMCHLNFGLHADSYYFIHHLPPSSRPHPPSRSNIAPRFQPPAASLYLDHVRGRPRVDRQNSIRTLVESHFKMPHAVRVFPVQRRIQFCTERET